jgi:transcription elongation factor Elf1
MKNEPDEIHFDCPKCKRPMSGDKSLLGEMINCPDCKEPFVPTPHKPEPEPEPVKPEIRLECPKCLHKFKFIDNALSHEFITCPSCGGEFSPLSPVRQLAGRDSVNTLTDLVTRREKIERNAFMLSAIGGFFAVIGLLVGVFSILVMKSGEDATDRFIASAAMIGVGLWFYLVGQVVYIRANTEK